MDKATVGGLVMGGGLLFLAIMIAPGSTLSAFVDYPSAAVVIGGAISAAFIAFPLKTMLSIFKVSKKLLKPKTMELAPVVRQLVKFSEIARKDGILALENKTDEIEDSFILKGVQMAVDGVDNDLLENILRAEIDALSERHRTGKAMFDTLGRYAPAFGMIGTLIGLIIMLGNMDDPDAIGPGMAVALITTLYGAIISNLFCLPFADKLAFYSRREIEVREVVLKGILAIQEGDNPRMVEQKLMTMLPADQQKTGEAA